YPAGACRLLRPIRRNPSLPKRRRALSPQGLEFTRKSFLRGIIPFANARTVQPPWVVVRWVYGDCKIWRNDINAPWGLGWPPVAFAGTHPEAYDNIARSACREQLVPGGLQLPKITRRKRLSAKAK